MAYTNQQKVDILNNLGRTRVSDIVSFVLTSVNVIESLAQTHPEILSAALANAELPVGIAFPPHMNILNEQVRARLAEVHVLNQNLAPIPDNHINVDQHIVGVLEDFVLEDLPPIDPNRPLIHVPLAPPAREVVVNFDLDDDFDEDDRPYLDDNDEDEDDNDYAPMA